MANFAEIGGQSGIESPTAQSWCGILERNQVCFRLPTYSRNLSKRIVKAPKTYFLDVGLAARLQGWSDLEPLKKSPAIGALFETLVVGELVRLRDHRVLDLKLSYWRTRDGEEIDFIVEGPNQKTLVIESKYASQSVAPPALSTEFKTTVGAVAEKWIVTYGGSERNLEDGWRQIPVSCLADRLEEVMRG